MQYMSSPVEQIKQRLTIVDVVGSYIKLTKAGANYKAVCPFHSEKAPSFYVSPPREIWHCFGCNLGGDMFEFVKQIEGVEFVEALRILASRAGVELKAEDPKFRNERTRLLDLHKDAVTFYRKTLKEATEVLKYLKDRGVSEESLNNFELGYAPSEEKGWRGLFNYLKGRGYSGQEMEKAGLVIKKDANDFYDRFRGRIMFPLFDASGRVVAFSGRVFGEAKGDAGKYINTPQTILYDKSKLLYGFDRAKIEIRKQDCCVFVEGQMDVIMSQQAGVLNTVAVSGTALTPVHLDSIKRLCSNLIMAFDSDEAGLLAAKRSIDLALEKDFEVRAVSMPEGGDPADMVQKDGKEWKKLIKEAKHIIEFYLDVLRERHGDEREYKKQIEKNLLPYLLSLSSGIERSHWVKEISKRIDVKEDIVLGELQKIFNQKKGESAPPESSSDNRKNICKISEGNREAMLLNRLSGIALWKNKGVLPEDIKERVGGFLKGADTASKDKLALEAELCYVGMEEEDFKEEIESLAKEFEKENIKNKLEILAKDIQSCEDKCDKEELDKKLEEFKKLSAGLAEL